MTDEEIMRQADADFDAAIDPNNPNAKVISGIRRNKATTLDEQRIRDQMQHVEARIKQAVRAAGRFTPSLDRFKR